MSNKKRESSREYARRKRATPEGRAHLKKIADKYRRKKAGNPSYESSGFCEICHHKKKTVMDHDHCTGKFRGWICASCNRGLGLLGDTESRIADTLRYLRGDKCLLGVI